MENKTLIFIILAVLLIGLGAALINASKKIISENTAEKENIQASDAEKENIAEEKAVDMEALEKKYTEETSAILHDYEELASESGASGLIKDEDLEKLSGLKEALISAVVPPRYKDLHLRLVLLFSDSGQLGSGKGLAAVRDVKNDFDWLN